ncbi:MAG TPA: hypothetical protein PKK00_03185 [Bacteroidales bacterium]|nr:hypothetical protein [Bacteroidales bacterium]HPS15675.1 hypothetical protein [Bacteroidales bacterium]
MKKTSRTLQKAMKRLAGVKAISGSLDLGNSMSVAGFESKILDVENKISSYNKLLADADAALNDFLKSENDLAGYSKRMLEAVASVYGHDSNEYEQAGGKRDSDRKRPVRKTKVKAS